ncbi:hypothetical protein RDI58_017568 [Solanum bulbocastanum]|uniref:Uncharacterized protein n=1 Tax=Solanum bulbocastanum TaxID=147425 RepID=A0AAN8TCK5_SOLBU
MGVELVASFMVRDVDGGSTCARFYSGAGFCSMVCSCWKLGGWEESRMIFLRFILKFDVAVNSLFCWFLEASKDLFRLYANFFLISPERYRCEHTVCEVEKSFLHVPKYSNLCFGSALQGLLVVFWFMEDECSVRAAVTLATPPVKSAGPKPGLRRREGVQVAIVITCRNLHGGKMKCQEMCWGLVSLSVRCSCLSCNWLFVDAAGSVWLIISLSIVKFLCQNNVIVVKCDTGCKSTLISCGLLWECNRNHCVWLSPRVVLSCPLEALQYKIVYSPCSLTGACCMGDLVIGSDCRVVSFNCQVVFAGWISKSTWLLDEGNCRQ